MIMFAVPDNFFLLLTPHDGKAYQYRCVYICVYLNVYYIVLDVLCWIFSVADTKKSERVTRLQGTPICMGTFVCRLMYWVATISRLREIVGLFCRIQSLL